MFGVLIKQCNDRDTQREDRGRDWSYAAMSQGIYGPLETGRGKEGLFPKLSDEA